MATDDLGLPWTEVGEVLVRWWWSWFRRVRKRERERSRVYTLEVKRSEGKRRRIRENK